MEALQRDLAEVVSGASDDFISLELDKEDARVTLRLREPSSVSGTVECLFPDLESYPRSAAFISTEEGAWKERVDTLCSMFEDRADLKSIVWQVTKRLSSKDPEALYSWRCPGVEPQRGSDSDQSFASGSEYSDGDGDGGSEDEASSGSELDPEDINEEDEEDMKAEMMALARWKRVETAKAAEDRRLAEARAKAADSRDGLALHWKQQQAMALQIFNTAEGFTLLCNELQSLQRQMDLSLMVDAVDDDVYVWKVVIGDWEEGTQFAQDMEAVRRAHAYSTLEVRLRFMRGLHPFYPPQLELIRPRMVAPAYGALASHPAVCSLQAWDPWRPIAHTIRTIKSFVQENCRVDLDHPRNDAAAHPASAYSEMEHLLVRLEAVSGHEPLCMAQHRAMYDARTVDLQAGAVSRAHERRSQDGEQPPRKQRRREGEGGDDAEEQPRQRAWAKGTGYGSDYLCDSRGQGTWNPKATDAAQACLDAERGAVLAGIAAEFKRIGGVPPLLEALDAKDGSPAESGSTSGAGGSSSPGAAGSHADAGVSNPGADARPPTTARGDPGEPCTREEALRYVRDSCLLPVLVHELSIADFKDMSERTPFYTRLLTVVAALATPDGAHLLALRPPAFDGKTLCSLLRPLAARADRFLAMMRSARAQQPPAPTQPQPTSSTPPAAAQAQAKPPPKPSKAEQKAALDEARTIAVAEALAMVAAAAAALERGSRREDAPSEGEAAPGVGEAAPREGEAAAREGEAAPSVDAAQAYADALRPLLAREANVSGHRFEGTAGKELVRPKARIMRIAKEFAGLEANLPLSEGSSMFVVADRRNFTLWRALITGPDDTPYAGGCFVFDIFFPQIYPACPPQVTLVTTGGGTVRFNPNLYKCGKVCLSLLGTWSGSHQERWQENASSILQVLISIQALILVDLPYYNEPGHEASMHTASGKRSSDDYNKNILEKTIEFAMVDILKHPPKEFKDVIEAHFRLRGPHILENIQKQIASATGSHKTALCACRQKLAGLIDALE